MSVRIITKRWSNLIDGTGSKSGRLDARVRRPRPRLAKRRHPRSHASNIRIDLLDTQNALSDYHGSAGSGFEETTDLAEGRSCGVLRACYRSVSGLLLVCYRHVSDVFFTCFPRVPDNPEKSLNR